MPGGAFSIVMCSPDGQAFPENSGCVLVVEPERRLIWTNALGPRFRPNPEAFMTAEITMELVTDGTRYRALVRHKSTENRTKHEQMGWLLWRYLLVWPDFEGPRLIAADAALGPSTSAGPTPADPNR